jgi:hypothetical protein
MAVNLLCLFLTRVLRRAGEPWKVIDSAMVRIIMCIMPYKRAMAIGCRRKRNYGGLKVFKVKAVAPAKFMAL